MGRLKYEYHPHRSMWGVWDEKGHHEGDYDGLDETDWRNWFEGYDLTEPMAVIQFTKFRY